MEESGTVSKKTLSRLVFSLAFLFFVIANLAVVCVCWACGFKFPTPVMSGLGVLYLFLAHAAADKILKRFGLSRSGTVVEVRSRTSFRLESDASAGEFVEARLPSDLITVRLIGLPAFGLLSLFTSLLVVSRATGAMLGLGMVMGVGGAYILFCSILVVLDYNNPQVRVDAEGVWGFSSKRTIRRVFVPWSDVVNCEIRTTYNTFGEPVLLRPIFKGHNGETLLDLNLVHTPMVEQERVVKFIKARLPKPQVDPWEL